MTGLVGAITLPDGTAVRGRGRREPVPAGPLPDFGLYLGKPGQWQPEWAAEWIDWPDFRTPRDAHERGREHRRRLRAGPGRSARGGRLRRRDRAHRHRPRVHGRARRAPGRRRRGVDAPELPAPRRRDPRAAPVGALVRGAAGLSDAIFIPSLPTTGRRTLHNPRVSILSRAGLILAATVFAAACAPADAPTAAGPSASASAAAEACPSGGLPTLTAGTLTIGTDQPVYQPWYVDDAPENGQGFESAVAYAIAEQLGYPKDKVAWARVPFNAAIQPGPKPFDLNLTEFSITDERRQAVDFSAPYYDVKQAVVALVRQPVRQRHERRRSGRAPGWAPRSAPPATTRSTT